MVEAVPRRVFPLGGIRAEVFDDGQALGRRAAARVAERLRRAVAQRGEAGLILATGVSQYAFLDALRQESVPWERVTAFHLDEYLGLPADHPASFRRYLHERVFRHLPFGAVHLLRGDAPGPEGEAERYSRLLEAAHIDVACLGVGENGHLAFNDPPADLDTDALVHIVRLDEACRRQQVGEGHFGRIEDVPERALSLSVPAILRAEAISCVAPERRKAEAVRAALEGPISPWCPASALRRHPQVWLYLDLDSAALLSPDLGEAEARPSEEGPNERG